jgi:hypothetical protein
VIRARLDKIASAARNAGVGHDVYLSEEIVAREGYVVAVRVKTDKAVYNQLENVEGRMMRLRPGDRFAGVLGHRRALRGYAGEVPEDARPGDTLHVLNLGGVIGRCTSYAPDLGRPFEVEVMGQVLHFPYLGKRIGEPAHIGLGALEPNGRIETSAPIVAVMGTCMNAGKTAAACEIIHGLTRRGLRVAAGKVTGVALQRDVLNMLDHGAVEALSFVDAGVTTTDERTAPGVVSRIVARLNDLGPDVMVLEFGDGILGEYGVQAILARGEVGPFIRIVVLCAADPVGAWGGVRLLGDAYGLETGIVTGPVTDNEVGRQYVAAELGVPAANALVDPGALVEHVWQEVGP